MTREEIKDELCRMLSDVVNGGYPKRNNTQRGRYREAVKEILKVLEQEPCEDAISRQAVLDYAKDTCLDLDSFEDTEVFCDEIKLLPSVTPQYTDAVGIDKES